MKEIRYKTKLCIVGLGPAGIGAAITFEELGLSRDIILIDMGKEPIDRYCELIDNKSCIKEFPCQMISGFGGSSLLSGSKLSSFPAGSKLVDIIGSKELAEKYILKALDFFDKNLSLKKLNITIEDKLYAEKFFENSGFLYKFYEVHLFNQEELRLLYQKTYNNLKKSVATVLLNTEVIDVNFENGYFKLLAKQNDKLINIDTNFLILGIGRLGKDFLMKLNKILHLNGKDNILDIGVRIEFPTSLFPNISKYHFDLKLLFNNARTFCVCEGGKVAHYVLNKTFFTEGYFNSKEITKYTNLGILIRLEPSKKNEFTKKQIFENLYKTNSTLPLFQNLTQYLNNGYKSSECFNFSSTSINNCKEHDLNKIFPKTINNNINYVINYFIKNLLKVSFFDAINIFAPELDFGGLKFSVKSDFSIKPKMYLIGDCIGRFRGILQAFSSGILCAENIINNEKWMKL